jgi:hypothetical protein
MRLINPKALLRISLNGEMHEIRASGDEEDADLSFQIEKDLSEEPNSAEFILYNLKQDSMAMLSDAASNEAPVYFSAGTIEDPGGSVKQAFAGEIFHVESENMRPGFETRVSCLSQKRNHREFRFQKTYSAGTYADEIINDLVDTIGLPRGGDWQESAETIILSKSFAGPAYRLLQRFMFDRGMYCYIMDGMIHASFSSVAPIGQVKTLDDYTLLGDPEDVVRMDRSLIEMKTVIEVSGKLSDAFVSRATRKRRRKKKIEIYGKNDLVEFEAVEQDIPGKVFRMFMQPDFNPDDMFRYNILLYRGISVEHEGSTFDGTWDTVLTTDLYEDTGGDFA